MRRFRAAGPKSHLGFSRQRAFGGRSFVNGARQADYSEPAGVANSTCHFPSVVSHGAGAQACVGVHGSGKSRLPACALAGRISEEPEAYIAVSAGGWHTLHLQWLRDERPVGHVWFSARGFDGQATCRHGRANLQGGTPYPNFHSASKIQTNSQPGRQLHKTQ